MDSSQSLEQLEGQRWGDPPTDASGLIVDVHRLRLTPIHELTNDDLRHLLSQRVGSDWLVELAIDRLAESPMVGDLYPGDLLRAVLRTEAGYWELRPNSCCVFGPSARLPTGTIERSTGKMRRVIDEREG